MKYERVSTTKSRDRGRKQRPRELILETLVIGHVTPEAIEGGNIALARNGDQVRIDAEKNTIDLLLDDAKLSKRRAAWKKPRTKSAAGHFINT